MTSVRPYRNSIPLETVKNELKQYSGIQFDPNIASVFLDILEKDYSKIKEIQEKYAN